MVRQRPMLSLILEVCWLLVSLGFGITLPGACATDRANAISDSQRLQANSNQFAAGILANGVLTIDLEVRQGEWFPENNHGPSLKIFAFVERGKPAQFRAR